MAAHPSAATPSREDALLALAFSPQPLSRLPAEFGPALARGSAYARFLSAHFPADAAPGSCVVFPGLPGEERAIFVWSGNFPKPSDRLDAAKFLLVHWALGFFSIFLHAKEKPVQVRFCTAHDFCHLAARAQRRAWHWSQTAWWAGALAASAACLAGLISAVLGFVVIADLSWLPGPQHERNAAAFVFWLAVFLALALAAWWLVRLARRLRLPPALRTLEKWPFRLESVTWSDLP